MPVLYVATRTGQAGPAGLWDEFARPYAMGLLGNTLTLAISVTLLTTVLGTAMAWATERTDLPGRGLWRVVASLPLAMPAFVASYAWASLGPGFQGMAGAILVLTLSSLPLIYLPVAAALRGMDPVLEDVTRSLGSGPWRSFVRAVLPQAAPALGGGALLVASHMLAEFGALSLLRVETLTTAIFDQYQMRFDTAAAALLSAGLMALCLPVAFAELRMRGRRRVARVGRGVARRASPVRLGWAAPAVAAGFVAMAGLALGVPLATLAYWTTHGTSVGRGLGTVGPALLGSLALSVPGAALTTLLALPLVLLALRHRGRMTAVADRMPYLVHGLPGVTVALSLAFLAVHYAPGIYQTRLLVMLAYAVLFLPLAQSAVRASAELVPAELEDVARTLGRGPFMAFATTTLPGLAPGIAAAMALLVLSLMRELTATLLLAGGGRHDAGDRAVVLYRRDRLCRRRPVRGGAGAVLGPAGIPADRANTGCPRPPLNQLRVEGLCKRYGVQTVLHGVDLAVAAGSITALLGASGCGKTTLLRLVAGFDRADAGTIAIGGHGVSGPDRHVPPERRRIGYVPQEGALFPHLTVAGNVGYGLDRAGRRSGRVEQVLRLTGLEALAARTPNQLSGGQQQRTAWPAPWRLGQAWCCWTNRSTRWTASCGQRSART